MEVKNRIAEVIRGKVLPLILVLAVTMAVQALTNVRSAMCDPLTTDDLNILTPKDLAEFMTSPNGGIHIIDGTITYAGDDAAAGTFSGGSGIIDIDTGVILSAGRIDSVVGPNISDKTQQSFGGVPGDPDLDIFAGQPTKDAAALEFKFTSDSNKVECTFMIAAEEYNEDVNDKFNNEFAIWIDVNGDGIIDPLGEVRSYIPGTTIPVRINTVNGGKSGTCDDKKDNDKDGLKDGKDPDCGNPCDSIVGEDPQNPYYPDPDDPSSEIQLFFNNDVSDPDGGSCPQYNIEADGFTAAIRLTATLDNWIDNNDEYTIKIAIADARNRNFTSWIMIEEGSFRNPTLCTDTDGDGFGDPDTDLTGCASLVEDNCPFVFNPSQNDGDGDGLGDGLGVGDTGEGCDPCPDDPENDADGDGVCESDDNCPDISNPGQEDTDSDGVGNDCDNCWDVPNADQADDDGDGIGNVCDLITVPAEERPVRAGGSPSEELTDTDSDGLPDDQEIVTDATIADSDGDGVSDGSLAPGGLVAGPDNCPVTPNSDQADNDGDGIGDECDTDDDNDGHLDGADNCQFAYNPDQADLDIDGDGDVCDLNADGDLVAAADGDCDDLDASVYPGATEITGNGKDDDCNPATPDTLYDITFSSNPIDTWLPTDGGSITITAEVNGPDGLPLVPQPTVSFSVVSVTNHPGRYTNDDSIDTSDDFSFNATTGELTSYDYGGSITIHSEAYVDTDADAVPDTLVQRDLTLPMDSDGDDLPDAWESQYGDLTRDGDIDTSGANSFAGDGLTNFEEYRGAKWVQLDLDSSGTYKTTAYVPQSAVSHFRTDPDRKDLFVEYTGYDTTNPFAIGSAFDNAEIDVHAGDSADLTGSLVGTANIDVLLVTNDLVYTYLGVDGHINKRSGVREYSWDTKGSSNIGTSGSYGLNCRTYQRALDGYFGDRTHQDGGGSIAANGELDPVGLVEDRNDNGVIDGKGPKYEDKLILQNSIFDGDHVILGSFLEALSIFDIDNNGLVELPTATDPASIDANFEYTKAQVLKHTIIHEMGHAVGLPHNTVSDSLMYQYSNNWSRDDFFSDDSKGQILIHNN